MSKSKLIIAIDTLKEEKELENKLENKKEKKDLDEYIKNINTEFKLNYFYSINDIVYLNKLGVDPNYYSNIEEKEEVKERKKEVKIKEVKKDTCYSSCIGYNSCLSKSEIEVKVEVKVEVEKISNKKNIIKTKKEIDITINNIKDLIKLVDDNPLDDSIEYNINMIALHKIQPELIMLDKMIGMNDLKENIVDQILYYIQELNTTNDFMHTVIYGPPGTGKTEMAKIIGHIFSKLGVLKKGTFKKVTRSDLIAGYLGQTAMKTRDVINECLGGVLFIDEAYALGNTEKRDSFSKECIDTICEALSNHKENLMVIIAGYEKELNECFFNYNQGLDSRFTWRFKTDEYKGDELCKIFIKKVNECNWSIDINKINGQWFNNNLIYFKFFGRDIETLLAKTKIAHSRRIFGKSTEEKMKITISDLENGFKLYLKNSEVKNRKSENNSDQIIKSMYV